MTERRRNASRGLICLVAAVVMALTVTLPARASTDGASTARSRATAAVSAMMGFYDESTGRWDSDAPWWQSGNALQALLDYMVKTRSTQYMPQVLNTVELQRKPLPWWPQGGGEFRADSTDDTGWWALAMVRLYDLTHDRRYLDIAKTDEAYMRQYWDGTCDGGIWWDLPGKTYKNAISNELYLQLTASLHNRIPGDRTYLSHALQEWRWFAQTGMINSGHLVNDGLQTQSGSCASNGGTTWTYNQGVVLGGLTELYRATHDANLLTTAGQIAHAVIASPDLSPGGILTEPCEPAGTCNSDQSAFKGVFARNLAELDKVTPAHPYRGYLLIQARSAYDHDRNGSEQYGLHWAGPFDQASIARQESAVSLLTATL
ncbi:hypothetical protein GCM10029978_054570 [Actinoallomurus acanthiterrae]